MRQLQKKLKSGSLDLKQDDPFELFIAATTIRYCYYAETHKILGNTYGMCVLQVCAQKGAINDRLCMNAKSWTKIYLLAGALKWIWLV